MIQKNFAGLDGFVWWMGVVENRQDPLGLGRCQVRIYGFHSDSLSDVPTENLPWAHPVHALNTKSFTTPKESEVVFGFFADGRNGQYPIMMGVVPGFETNPKNTGSGFHDLRSLETIKKAPKEVVSVTYKTDGSGIRIAEANIANTEVLESLRYPHEDDLGEQTISQIARVVTANSVIQRRKSNIDRNVLAADGLSWEEPYPAWNPRYPYNQVVETESGNVFEIDDTPRNERISLAHRSGTFMEMYPSGTKVEKVTKSNYEIIMADDYVHIMGKAFVTVQGDVKIKVFGDVSVEAGNDLNVKVSGKMNLSVKEELNIKAKSINIDAENQLETLSGTYTRAYAGTSYNIRSKTELYSYSGTTTHIKSGGAAYFNSGGSAEILASGDVNIDGAKVNLGDGAAAASISGLAVSANLDSPEARLQRNTAEPEPDSTPIPLDGVIQNFDAYQGYAYKQSTYKDTTEEGEKVEPPVQPPQQCNFDQNSRTFIGKSSWNIGQKGLDLIKEFEGFESEAYVDPGTGAEPITIGYGSTASAIDQPVTLGMTCTKAQAEEWLKYGITKKFLPSLKRYVTVDLTQEMVDACLSFIYNVGGGNFASSTLLKKINQKDWCGAGDEFLRWNKAAGKVLPGLTRRRTRERELFLT